MANELQVLKQNTVDVVAAHVRKLQESGELHLPPDYSAQNALKAAWLILQETRDKNGKPVLQSCTRESIINALLDMVVQGLNPVRKQCYFVPFGNKLVCMRSYFGDMALVKRVLPQADIWFGVVYEGDDFEYTIERGRRRIVKHHQKVENIRNDKILAAYCVIDPGDGGEPYTEIMSIDQIKQSWRQSQTYRENGDTPHNKFTDQMCIRTVVRRACKYVINSASDDYLLLYHANRADEEAAEAEMEAEVAANANGRVIDVEPRVQADAEAGAGAEGEVDAELEAEAEPEPPADEPPANGKVAAGAEQLTVGPGF